MEVYHAHRKFRPLDAGPEIRFRLGEEIELPKFEVKFCDDYMREWNRRLEQELWATASL